MNVRGAWLLPLWAGLTATSCNETARFAADDLAARLDASGADASGDAFPPRNGDPILVKLSPSYAVLQPGESRIFSVALDLPAPNGGIPVAIDARRGKVSVPMKDPAVSVTVPPGKSEATFTYTMGMVANDVVTAQLGFVVKSATVSRPVSHMVINEVDYDQPGADDEEFVEIFNAGNAAMDMSAYALVFIDGANNTEYLRVPLAGMLLVNSYLVVGARTVIVPKGALKVDFKAAQDNIRNGGRGGIALVDTVGQRVADVLSYGGAITMAQINGMPGPVNLVEVAPTPIVDDEMVTGSLVRMPNGLDTNNAASDWQFSTQPTPGESNL